MRFAVLTLAVIVGQAHGLGGVPLGPNSPIHNIAEGVEKIDGFVSSIKDRFRNPFGRKSESDEPAAEEAKRFLGDLSPEAFKQLALKHFKDSAAKWAAATGLKHEAPAESESEEQEEDDVMTKRLGGIPTKPLNDIAEAMEKISGKPEEVAEEVANADEDAKRSIGEKIIAAKEWIRERFGKDRPYVDIVPENPEEEEDSEEDDDEEDEEAKRFVEASYGKNPVTRKDPCALVRCASGTQCKSSVVRPCMRAPCRRTAKCVATDPCALVRCASGTKCKSSVVRPCMRAPCRRTAKCVATGNIKEKIDELRERYNGRNPILAGGAKRFIDAQKRSVKEKFGKWVEKIFAVGNKIKQRFGWKPQPIIEDNGVPINSPDVVNVNPDAAA